MGKEEHRRHIRFDPDKFDIAILSNSSNDVSHYDETTANFEGKYVALICDESHEGCNLIVKSQKENETDFDAGKHFILKLGKLPPMPAMIRWQKVLSPGIFQIGMRIEKN